MSGTLAVKSLRERVARATEGAPGTVLILSANPMHDTGGGQRSAQMALELLESGYAVVFVSHGRVTETVDLGLRFRRPRLVETSLKSFTGPAGKAARSLLWERGVSSVITQVPVRAWLRVLDRASAGGAVTVYDCVDRWDSELGKGWYRPEVERRVALDADLVVASAPQLVRRLERMAEREIHLVPNAYNGRIFDSDASHARPADLPEGRVALYVGALWGGWFDWSLVGRLAADHPDTNFVFVGDYRDEGVGLPANCVFLGLKPQPDLPPYLAHADLAVLPWTRDDVTQATSPLKVYEFVGMGLPVVAPDLDPLRGIPGVTLVDGPGAFSEAVGRVGRSGLDAGEREAMERFSDGNSWSRRMRDLGSLVGQARTGGRMRIGQDGRLPPGAGGPGGWPRSRAVISVVIPSYNHARYIGEALGSVHAQSLPAGDVVVVDDGSTDDSLSVIDEARWDAVRVVRQENRGAHETINRAVALSEGDYVAILNSDDRFAPERLEHAWAVARATDAALVIGGVRWVDGEGAPLPADHPGVAWYREALATAAGRRSLRGAALVHNVAVTTSNFFMHRALWRALGGFRDLRYVHDLDFLVRAVELCGARVVFEPGMVDVDYRVHGENTISESTSRALAERRGLVKTLQRPLGRVRRVAQRIRQRAPLLDAVAATRELRPIMRSGSDTAERSPEPLRVGLVVEALDLGGLEEIVALLARTLPAQGVTPLVLCTHSGGRIARRLADAGVSVEVADGAPRTWRAWMTDASPDVVSTHFADLEVIEALAGSGAPVVETVQNTYAWFGEREWTRERSKLCTLDATVAVSDLVARYHALHTDGAPTPHIIPNAVHPGRAAMAPRDWARERLGLEPDGGAPVFVHHGRFARQKNLIGLVRAFERLLRDVPAATLILAGPRSERGYFREVRRVAPGLFRRGTIRALPPVRHIGALLSAADAYVSNSFFEGWSVAASEAAWVGLPLVLSDCGGSRELVEDGVWGRLVPNAVGDPLSVDPRSIREPPAEAGEANEDALAAALHEVVQQRSEWSARAPEIRARARRDLGPEPMARAYAALFRFLVGADR
ncbi:MAG: glycosyltransferase [Gemmatimonadota bacterium]